MKKTLFMILMSLLSLNVSAAGGSAYPLDDFKPLLGDKAALQRGAKWYISYCYGCHSMQYQRYERVANDLGIPHEVALDTMIFDGSKIGELMEIGMDKSLAKKWFGAAPPDLTLVARLRGTDWLYTYLRTFYKDPSRPYGVNNLVFKDVGMPHVLLEVQGEQVCKPGWAKAPNGGIAQDPLTGEWLEDEHSHCGRVEHVEGTGEMTPDEYDQLVAELVSFLAYSAEPTMLERDTLFGVHSERGIVGIYVLLFLAFFLIWAWLLNREYWKDVH